MAIYRAYPKVTNWLIRATWLSGMGGFSSALVYKDGEYLGNNLLSFPVPSISSRADIAGVSSLGIESWMVYGGKPVAVARVTRVGSLDGWGASGLVGLGVDYLSGDDALAVYRPSGPAGESYPNDLQVDIRIEVYGAF